MDPLDPSTWPAEALSFYNIRGRAEKAKRCAAAKDVLGWLAAVNPKTYHLPFCELHRFQAEIRHDAESGVEAPRYHAKTAIGCAGIPLYGALEEPELYDYFLNVQATERKALAVNTGIKLELEQNEVLRYLYGDQTSTEKWTDFLFVLRNHVVFQAATTGQSLKGTNYRLRRPNYVILDDAYNDDHIRNPEMTMAVNDWVESTLEPLMANDRSHILRWQGTAVNDADGLKKLEAKSKVSGSSTRFRRFTAHGEFVLSDDGVTMTWADTDKVLWPELRSIQKWRAMKAEPGRNQVTYNREHLCVRSGAGESVVHEEWMANPSWEYDPDQELRFGIDHILLSVIICCDPSVGKKAENDPTGLAAILKTQRMDGSLPKYFIDALRNERLGPQQRIDQIKAWVRDYRRRFTMAQSFEVIIETVAGFADFGDIAAGQLDVPVTVLPETKDKLARLEAKAILFQNRRVFLNKRIDALLKTTIKQQLTTNYPTNDDLRDAAIMALDPKDMGIGLQ